MRGGRHGGSGGGSGGGGIGSRKAGALLRAWSDGTSPEGEEEEELSRSVSRVRGHFSACASMDTGSE